MNTGLLLVLIGIIVALAVHALLGIATIAAGVVLMVMRSV